MLARRKEQNMTITLTRPEYKNLRYALLSAAQTAFLKGNKEYVDELLDLYEKIIRQGWEKEK